jgi:hypothetical protein
LDDSGSLLSSKIIFTDAKIVYKASTWRKTTGREFYLFNSILAQNLHIDFGGRKRMQTLIDTALREQIEEALKRAKDKKVLYLYDDAGYKRLLGVFDKKKASRIKRKLKNQRLINRVTEFDIRTTEPDSHWG